MKNLKKNHICVLAIFLNMTIGTLGAYAQTPGWLWARSAGGSGSDIGTCITTDDGENVYVTGIYSDAPISFGTTTLNNAGGADIFLVKYDVSGNVLWARSAGGSGDDGGFGLCTDASQNIYVTGHFTGDSVSFGTTTLNNAGGRDMFIVKYDSNGNLLWAKSGGGSLDEYSAGIVTDHSGNAYVSGHFNSPSTAFGTNVFTNNGSFDTYIVKYAPDGTVLWAKSAGESGTEFGRRVGTDSSGNLYATGVFNSSDITFGGTKLTNAGNNYEIYIVKFDTDGDLLWAKSAGGAENEFVYGLTIDGSGNPFLAGSFFGQSFTMGTTTLYNHGIGPSDMFVAKYDPDGNVLWARSGGSENHDDAITICTDGSGNVVVAGRFNSFSIIFGTTTLTNAGNYDLFIVKYDPAGNVLWAKSSAGINREVANSITVSSSGNAYVTGEFSGTPAFGSDTLKYNGGFEDAFIAKLNNGHTGISEFHEESGLNVFPNPCNGSFRFSGLGPGQWTISIYTIGNKCIYQAKHNDQQSAIDLSGQPKGIYFYRISNDKEMLRPGKLIVE